MDIFINFNNYDKDTSYLQSSIYQMFWESGALAELQVLPSHAGFTWIPGPKEM